MTDTPLTDQQLDLDEIEARSAHLYEYIDQPEEADLVTGTDVPALVAEVRRLRAELADLKRIVTPRTLRICACGHGHLAHAAPAPHGCFAYGQTCPCKAYRQLPHEEAVAQLERNLQAAAERVAAEELFTGTRQCGHDDYHDPHEWADQPNIWCPGHSFEDDAEDGAA